MTRLIPLAVVARALSLEPSYVRRIAADQGRPKEQRRYSEATHARIPLFIRDGNSRAYVCTEQTVIQHLKRRNRHWQPQV